MKGDDVMAEGVKGDGVMGARWPVSLVPRLSLRSLRYINCA